MPHRRAALAATVAVLLAIVAGCGGSASTAPSPSPPAPTPAAPTEVPAGPTPSPGPGTFETDWGEAWDALPPGFPVLPESTPADPVDPTGGPASGAFVVDYPAQDAAILQVVGLEGAGYSTDAVAGPYEDGSLVIDALGFDRRCRIQVTLRPAGGLTMITVLYGAACPWS